jgi:voltage-gated potassium channel
MTGTPVSTIHAMAGRITERVKETARERRVRLARLDRRLDALVFVAALLSIPAAAQAGDLTGVILVIDIVAWLIFVLEGIVKLSAHGREEYFGTRWNWIDIGIIVLSAPYHLATGIPLLARLGSLARLARLVRIALVMVKILRQGRAIMSRQNVPVAVGLVALATVGTAGFVFAVESRSGTAAFGDFGDALWWALVTLTTVGYGDITPLTTAGRIGAGVLMLVGIAFLGTLAATLASLFIDEETADQGDIAALRADIAELRRSVDSLAAKLDR